MIAFIFFFVAAMVLGAAIMVVTVRNIIHAALWLIASFFGVGALYILMEAEFLGVVQVLVYVGAISILILFAIMLTRDVAGEQRQLYQRWWIALVVTGALFGLLIVPSVYQHSWATIVPLAPGTGPAIATARELGIAFMSEYLIPFVLASVLLLVALIGAVVIAYDERARRRVLTLAEEIALRRSQAARGSEQPGDGQGEATEQVEEGEARR